MTSRTIDPYPCIRSNNLGHERYILPVNETTRPPTYQLDRERGIHTVTALVVIQINKDIVIATTDLVNPLLRENQGKYTFTKVLRLQDGGMPNLCRLIFCMSSTVASQSVQI